MELTQLKQTLQDNIEAIFKKLSIEYEINGDNIYAKCPIHLDSDNPKAFSYSIKRGIWKCWTRDCQSEHKNDVFGLIAGALSNMSGENVSFKDAVKWSYDALGIKQSRGKYQKRALTPQSNEIEDFYQMISIMQNVQAKDDIEIDFEYRNNNVSEYFLSRNFKKSTLKHFEVSDSQNSSIMKNRAIIPIHNDDGSKLVGLIGRSTKDYQQPKYLLYPKGFDKRCYFYNYHRAYDKATETSCLYILEGQGDVWRMYESGVYNAVSIFGKTLSDEQIIKLQKMPITHLIIIMDNDQAGRESRVTIQRQLGRMYKLSFPKLSHKDIGEMSTKLIKTNILSSLGGTY